MCNDDQEGDFGSLIQDDDILSNSHYLNSRKVSNEALERLFIFLTTDVNHSMLLPAARATLNHQVEGYFVEQDLESSILFPAVEGGEETRGFMEYYHTTGGGLDNDKLIDLYCRTLVLLWTVIIFKSIPDGCNCNTA